MAYEYCNPKKRAIECTIRRPIGTILIPGGTFVPTPEQEAAGVTAEIFKDYVGPSFLRPTPPAVRRRLLQAVGLPVPESIVTATAHLTEFGGEVGHEEAERVAAILDGLPAGATEGKAFRAIPSEEYEKGQKVEIPAVPENTPPLPPVAREVVPAATEPKPKVGPKGTVQEGTPPPSLGDMRRKLENTTASAKSTETYRSTQDELRKAMEAASSSFNMRRRHPLHKKV